MSNQETWLTAGDAAKILRVSTRQVHRYAEQGQLMTRRAGRRVLFSAASVAQLADDLAVDVRPAPPQRNDLMSPEMVRYLQDQADIMRRQGESSERIEQRLAEIEAKLGRPQTITIPTWLTISAVIAFLLLLAILILLVLRI